MHGSRRLHCVGGVVAVLVTLGLTGGLTYARLSDNEVLAGNRLQAGWLAPDLPAVCPILESTDTDPSDGMAWGYHVVLGTGQSDQLVGGNGPDAMFGLGGDDILEGGNGNDCLVGGAGDDVLRGGNGRDVLIGEGGSDDLEADTGKDALYGDDEDDTLLGGNAPDTLDGGAGTDVCDGGQAPNELAGCESGSAVLAPTDTEGGTS